MRRFLKLASGVVVVVTSSGASLATPQQCTIQTKFFCTLDGCQSVPVGVWNVWDPVTGEYARCDRLGCDTYQAIVTTSGQFLVIDVPGRGMLARLSVAGQFTEVVTLGNDTYLSFGSCVQ